MKRKILILAVISSLIFTSCKKDDDDPMNGLSTETSNSKIDSRLVGKWMHSSYSYDPFFGQLINTYNFELKENGNYYLKMNQHNNDNSFNYDSERIGSSTTVVVNQSLIEEWNAAFEDEDVNIDFKITTQINDKTYVEYIDLFENDKKLRYLWQGEDKKEYRVYSKQ